MASSSSPWGLSTIRSVSGPDVHYGAEAELSWMQREDGLARVRIDVDDPGEQNDLFERLMEASVNVG